MVGQSSAPDVADAEFVAAVLEAARQWEATTGRRLVQKPLREAIWFVWQRPRLGAAPIRGKYPKNVPWTKAARAAYRAGEPLEIEHVEPLELLIRRLLDDVPGHGELVEELHRSLQFAVVTPAENQRLGAVRARAAGDPWTRYRAAGIDVDAMRPLLPSEL